MIRPLVLAALVTLAACAKSEEASLVPIDEDEGFNVIDPVKTPVVEDRELSLGEWSQGMQDEQPALLFGPAGTEPLFSMRCDGRGGLLLQRHGIVPTGTAEMMTITLGSLSRRFAVNPVAATVPKLSAAIPAGDALPAQLSDADGTISVAVGDGPVLNLPADPAIGDFIHNCATNESPAPAAPDNGTAAQKTD